MAVSPGRRASRFDTSRPGRARLSPRVEPLEGRTLLDSATAQFYRLYAAQQEILQATYNSIDNPLWSIGDLATGADALALKEVATDSALGEVAEGAAWGKFAVDIAHARSLSLSSWNDYNSFVAGGSTNAALGEKSQQERTAALDPARAAGDDLYSFDYHAVAHYLAAKPNGSGVPPTLPSSTEPPPTYGPPRPPFTEPELVDLAYKFVKFIEGGVSKNPNDQGGLTNQGVTQSVYDHYRRSLHEKSRSVLKITDDEARAIFKKLYWDPSGAGRLPPLLGIVQADTAFNFGLGPGNLNNAQKGASDFLAETRHDAPPGASDLDLARIYVDKRIAFRYVRVKASPSQKAFLKGWLNRDNELLIYVNVLGFLAVP
jgi:hypothetical protein